MEVTASWTSYDDEFTATVKSFEDATAVLRTAEPDDDDLAPMVLFWPSPDGPFLGVSASDPAVLTFDTGLDPPYYVSAGDETREGTRWVIFGRQESEFETRSFVSRVDAEAALEEFLRLGTLPMSVRWEEV